MENREGELQGEQQSELQPIQHQDQPSLHAARNNHRSPLTHPSQWGQSPDQSSLLSYKSGGGLHGLYPLTLFSKAALPTSACPLGAGPFLAWMVPDNPKAGGALLRKWSSRHPEREAREFWDQRSSWPAVGRGRWMVSSGLGHGEPVLLFRATGSEQLLSVHLQPHFLFTKGSFYLCVPEEPDPHSFRYSHASLNTGSTF